MKHKLTMSLSSPLHPNSRSCKLRRQFDLLYLVFDALNTSTGVLRLHASVSQGSPDAPVLAAAIAVMQHDGEWIGPAANVRVMLLAGPDVPWHKDYTVCISSTPK